jgi:hypothetical protein
VKLPHRESFSLDAHGMSALFLICGFRRSSWFCGGSPERIRLRPASRTRHERKRADYRLRYSCRLGR